MKLDEKQLSILNQIQKGFPIVEKPYHKLAHDLKVSVDYILNLVSSLKSEKVISRIGPVFQPNSIGSSTLAAISCPEYSLDKIAEIVSSFDSVNHNYSRTHIYNLWFVVTAKDQDSLNNEILNIESATGLDVLCLPLVKEYHIDLGFNLEEPLGGK